MTALNTPLFCSSITCAYFNKGDNEVKMRKARHEAEGGRLGGVEEEEEVQATASTLATAHGPRTLWHNSARKRGWNSSSVSPGWILGPQQQQQQSWLTTPCPLQPLSLSPGFSVTLLLPPLSPLRIFLPSFSCTPSAILFIIVIFFPPPPSPFPFPSSPAQL